MTTSPRRLLPLLVWIALVGFVACDDDDGGPSGPGDGGITGSADFSRFVAIGNSLTAGVTDGALTAAGQQCSPPALLAMQVGIDDFEQPVVSDPGISTSGPGAGRLVIESLDPLVLGRAPAGQPVNASLPRPYDNLGVPSALGFEALTAEGQATSLAGNPFFDLVFRSFGTWLEQVDTIDPTFITLWLGNNDVLGYATSGGTRAGLPIPVTSFGAVYRTFLNQLLGFTDQIVLFNIPDVTSIPFFTTVPPVVVDPSTMQPVIGPDGNPIPLLGPDGPLAATDLVTLSALSLLAQGVGVPAAVGGSGQPLPDAVVLDSAEQTVAATTVAGYNQVIEGLAAANGLPVVDVNGLLRQGTMGGIPVEGGEILTDAFLTGGAFSLDGVHPTCKGYGAVTNELIRTINAEFGASIPLVNVAVLPGVALPMAAAAPRALRLPAYARSDVADPGVFAPR